MKTEKEIMRVSLDNLYGLQYGKDQHPNKPGMDGIQHQLKKLVAEGWQLVRTEGNQAIFERVKP